MREFRGVARCPKGERNEIMNVGDGKTPELGRRKGTVLQQRFRIARQQQKCIGRARNGPHDGIIGMHDERREHGMRNPKSKASCLD